MFGGKGGLGKTTFSAATAYYLAKKGKKVLVFSVDPQASLTDIFKRDIFGKGPTEIIPNLYAKEIDADKRVKEYQQEIRQKIFDMYGMDKIPEEIESYIQAAAAEPAMVRVVGFLLLNERFPRAVRTCSTIASSTVRKLRREHELITGAESETVLTNLRDALMAMSAEQVIDRGLHQTLDWIQAELIVATDRLCEEFFGYQRR